MCYLTISIKQQKELLVSLILYGDNFLNSESTFLYDSALKCIFVKKNYCVSNLERIYKNNYLVKKIGLFESKVT